MEKKKEPGRFSIKFNCNDPAHKTVIDLLNKQNPRGKAQFIANAVLHYIHCTETPDILQPVHPDSKSIETIVLDILNQQIITTIPITQNPFSNAISSGTGAALPSLDDAETLSNSNMDASSLASISDTLAAFRRTK